MLETDQDHNTVASKHRTDTTTPQSSNAARGRPPHASLASAPHEAALAAHRAELDKLLRFVEEGSFVGDKLRTLARMLVTSVGETDGTRAGGTQADLVEVGHLVADIMDTMAARLCAFEVQARTGLDHFLAGAAR